MYPLVLASAERSFTTCAQYGKIPLEQLVQAAKLCDVSVFGGPDAIDALLKLEITTPEVMGTCPAFGMCLLYAVLTSTWLQPSCPATLARKHD